jgi:hypothetical protein
LGYRISEAKGPAAGSIRGFGLGNEAAFVGNRHLKFDGLDLEIAN